MPSRGRNYTRRNLPNPIRTDDVISIAAWCAYSSALIGAIGIVSLIMFFALGQPYGTLNDVAVVAQYVLALPILVGVDRVLRPRASRLSTIAAATGVIGIAALVILQFLMIGRVLTFAQQGGLVSVALFVGVGGWILLVGYTGHATKSWPRSLSLAVLGWTYFGYPIWAVAVGRHLSSQALS